MTDKPKTDEAVADSPERAGSQSRWPLVSKRPARLQNLKPSLSAPPRLQPTPEEVEAAHAIQLHDRIVEAEKILNRLHVTFETITQRLDRPLDVDLNAAGVDTVAAHAALLHKTLADAIKFTVAELRDVAARNY